MNRNDTNLPRLVAYLDRPAAERRDSAPIVEPPTFRDVDDLADLFGVDLDVGLDVDLYV